MLNWLNEDLFFAVIDGANPVAWLPWSNETLTLGDLLNNWKRHAEGATQQSEQPKVTLIPLTDPIEHLQTIGRMQRIVGAVIETPSDPDDMTDYREKMDRLKNICRGIKKHAQDSDAMFQKVSFEIWFVVDDPDISRLSFWDEGARLKVARILGQDPMVRWIRNSASFLDSGNDFLADCRFNLTFGLN